MKLTLFLEEKGVSFEKHEHLKTYTAQGLAHEEHVSGYLVAKPVIVMGSSGPAMCVLAAPKHLDLGRAADVLGDNEVRLATESELGQLCPDCELGAEPPIGGLFGLKTIMDEGLKADEFLVMQAGTHAEAIQMRREDWERIAKPIVASIAMS